MSKVPVLFLVLVLFSVQGTNSTSNNDVEKTVWTAGSAVNVTFGPEDAVYCMLENNEHRPVFDGFGPCRVVLDRVTMRHRGYWKLWTGVPGTVIVRNRFIFVDVVAPVDTTPRVTGRVVAKHALVVMHCFVPEEYVVTACTFSDPSGRVFIANGEVTKEGYQSNNDIYSYRYYESYVDRHDCTFALLSPRLERPGIWRFAVHTTQATSHGFFVIDRSMLDNDYIGDHSPAELLFRRTDMSISNMEGEENTLSCSIDAVVRYCYFRAPNGTVYNVGPSTSSPGYEYVGKGFDAGDCGIRFNTFWESDEGQWTCNVGLKGNFTEQSAYINVYVNQRLIVNHYWQDRSVVVRLRIFNGPKLEYCRFVRSDGLGFTSENVPRQYVAEWGEDYGVCALTIPSPIVEDLRPWTMVAKVLGEDGEVSMTSTLDPRGQPSRVRPRAILLPLYFGTIFLLWIGVSCLPKKNRDWTYQRAAHIRNSFRRHPQPQAPPQPQQQNVTNVPQPIHTDILTDLPLKH